MKRPGGMLVFNVVMLVCLAIVGSGLAPLLPSWAQYVALAGAVLFLVLLVASVFADNRPFKP